MSSSPSIFTHYKESFYKKIFENYKSIFLFTCGSGLALYGAYHIYHHLIIHRNKALYETYQLNRKIFTLLPKYKNFVLLKILKKQQIEDPSGIIFEVILIENLSKKPSFDDNIKKADPFLPPFEDGQFIAEISNSHNLLFNKFALVKNHVLLTTKNFESQETPLNFQDFLVLVKTMRALEGFGFFNSGPASGFSVQHKHIQVIPLRNSNQCFGIFDLIKERIKEKTLIGGPDPGSYLLKEFRFRHLIRIIENNNEEIFEKTAECLLNNYLKALEIMENSDVKISYNMIITEEWILIVLREKAKALDNSIGMNALAYCGSYMVKNENEFENIINMKSPLKVLEEISLK